MWWIVIFVLAAPFLFFMGKQSSVVSSRRHASNLLGLFVLGIFLLTILIVGIYRWFDSRHAVTKTQNDLKALAVAVVEDEDGSVLLDWAAGKKKDAWGNTFLLLDNDECVQFSSKGPDGKYGTKDDILGVPFEKARPLDVEIKFQIKEVKEEAKSLWDEARSWWFRDKAH
jgi:hypothetical protein